MIDINTTINSLRENDDRLWDQVSYILVVIFWPTLNLHQHNIIRGGSPWVWGLNYYKGPFSIQCFRWSEGDGGGSKGKDNEAPGQVGEGFVHKASRGFPLV